MIVTKKGFYKFTRDYHDRGTTSVGTIPKGTVVEINQVSTRYKKVISPSFYDWHNWDLPVIKIDNPPKSEEKEKKHEKSSGSENTIDNKQMDAIALLKKLREWWEERPSGSVLCNVKLEDIDEALSQQTINNMICPVCQSNIQLSMYSGEGKGSGASSDK